MGDTYRADMASLLIATVELQTASSSEELRKPRAKSEQGHEEGGMGTL